MAEQEEFIDILVKLRRVMRDGLEIGNIRILHRESVIDSKVNPSHFHVALLPTDSWMKAKDIRAILEAGKSIKAPQQTQKVKAAIKKVQRYLKSN